MCWCMLLPAAVRAGGPFPAHPTAAALNRRCPRPSDADLEAIYRQPWMLPSPARPLPADRAALRRDAAAVSPYATDDCRDPLAPGGLTRPAWREVWEQVHAADRRRHHRAFAWMLMHAALPCGAAKVAFWPAGAEGLAEAACCGHSACRPQPAPSAPAAAWQLETLLHALLECPAVRPALRWAARLWVRIDGGGLPPLTPLVWIQGSNTWQPQHTHHAALWHTLRIALLSAVWVLRDRRAAWSVQFSPMQVVEAFVQDLRSIVLADWQRASSDITQMTGVSSSWFPRSGRQAAGFGVSDFESKWCTNGVIASVVHVSVGQPTVRFRLEVPSSSDLT